MAKSGLATDNLISRGAAFQTDIIFLALQDKKLAKRDLAHTRFGMCRISDIIGIEDVTWRAAGLCVVEFPQRNMIAVSGDGDVLTYSHPQKGTEHISGCRDLRGCASIGGSAHACGMARQVFRRDGDDRWTAMHAPFDQSEGIAGFEAIAGYARDDLYAVGWEGEIWQFDGTFWSNCESPVNVILSGVCCANDGFVYACGQAGTLLRGRNQTWELIETPGLGDDFWDVAYFDDRLYVSSMSALYTLKAGALATVEFGADSPESCYKLSVGDGVLWSVGQQDIFRFDKHVWQRWA